MRTVGKQVTKNQRLDGGKEKNFFSQEGTVEDQKKKRAGETDSDLS